MKKRLTVREIRRILFDTDMYAVIGADEMTNSDARRFLFDMQDQEAVMNVIENGNHLLVWH